MSITITYGTLNATVNEKFKMIYFIKRSKNVLFLKFLKFPYFKVKLHFEIYIFCFYLK